MYGGSVEQAENALAVLNQEAEIASRIPEGMHFQDLGLRLLKIDRERSSFINARRPFEQMLAATRSALWDFLIETEYQLTFGEATAHPPAGPPSCGEAPGRSRWRVRHRLIEFPAGLLDVVEENLLLRSVSSPRKSDGPPPPVGTG